MKAIQVANELLCSQRKLGTTFDIEKLKFGDKTILFDSVQNYARITGFPIHILLHNRCSPIRDGLRIHVLEDDIHIILYNENNGTPERIRWTKSHELGHVFLNHTKDGDIEEYEANAFAAQLLMPWFTIKMMGNIRKPSADYIAKTFGVSITAANKRILDVKRYTGAPTELDKKIYEKQRKYITVEPHDGVTLDVLNKILYASLR